MVSACFRILTHRPTDTPPPPQKKPNEPLQHVSSCRTPASLQRLHFYYEKLQVYSFLMNRCQKNAHDCLFRSTTTCFSSYRWQKHKSGELWSTFFGEKTGCGRVLSAGFTNPGFPGLGS